MADMQIFILTMVSGKTITLDVEACRGLSSASLVWVMRHNAKLQRIEPHGVVLLANNKFVVPGDGEIILV